MAWRDWLVKALYALLVLPSLLVMAFRLDDARLMWPANSVWERIAHSLGGLDVRGWLPAFSPREKETFARDTASVTAISLGIVILCFLLREPPWAQGDRAPESLRTDIRRYLLFAGVLVIVGLAWFFMLQHVHDGSAS